MSETIKYSLSRSSMRPTAVMMLAAERALATLVKAEAKGIELGWIYDYLVFGSGTTEDGDVGHSTHRGENRPNLVKCQIAQLD